MNNLKKFKWVSVLIIMCFILEQSVLPYSYAKSRKSSGADAFGMLAGALVLYKTPISGQSLMRAGLDYLAITQSPKVFKSLGLNQSWQNIGGAALAGGLIGGMNSAGISNSQSILKDGMNRINPYNWQKNAVLMDATKWAAAGAIQHYGHKNNWDDKIFGGATMLASKIGATGVETFLSSNIKYIGPNLGGWTLDKQGNSSNIKWLNKDAYNTHVASFKEGQNNPYSVGNKAWSFVAEGVNLASADLAGRYLGLEKTPEFSRAVGTAMSDMTRSIGSSSFAKGIPRALGTAALSGVTNLALQQVTGDMGNLGPYAGAITNLGLTSVIRARMSGVPMAKDVWGDKPDPSIDGQMFMAGVTQATGSLLSGGIGTLDPKGNIYYNATPDASYAAEMIDFSRAANNQTSSAGKYDSANRNGGVFNAIVNKYFENINSQANANIIGIMDDKLDKIKYVLGADKKYVRQRRAADENGNKIIFEQAQLWNPNEFKEVQLPKEEPKELKTTKLQDFTVIKTALGQVSGMSSDSLNRVASADNFVPVVDEDLSGNNGRRRIKGVNDLASQQELTDVTTNESETKITNIAPLPENANSRLEVGKSYSAGIEGSNDEVYVEVKSVKEDSVTYAKTIEVKLPNGKVETVEVPYENIKDPLTLSSHSRNVRELLSGSAEIQPKIESQKLTKEEYKVMLEQMYPEGSKERADFISENGLKSPKATRAAGLLGLGAMPLNKDQADTVLLEKGNVPYTLRPWGTTKYGWTFWGWLSGGDKKPTVESWKPTAPVDPYAQPIAGPKSDGYNEKSRSYVPPKPGEELHQNQTTPNLTLVNSEEGCYVTGPNGYKREISSSLYDTLSAAYPVNLSASAEPKEPEKMGPPLPEGYNPVAARRHQRIQTIAEEANNLIKAGKAPTLSDAVYQAGKKEGWFIRPDGTPYSRKEINEELYANGKLNLIGEVAESLKISNPGKVNNPNFKGIKPSASKAKKSSALSPSPSVGNNPSSNVNAGNEAVTFVPDSMQRFNGSTILPEDGNKYPLLPLNLKETPKNIPYIVPEGIKTPLDMGIEIIPDNKESAQNQKESALEILKYTNKPLGELRKILPDLPTYLSGDIKQIVRVPGKDITVVKADTRLGEDNVQIFTFDKTGKVIASCKVDENRAYVDWAGWSPKNPAIRIIDKKVGMQADTYAIPTFKVDLTTGKMSRETVIKKTGEINGSKTNNGNNPAEFLGSNPLSPLNGSKAIGARVNSVAIDALKEMKKAK